VRARVNREEGGLVFRLPIVDPKDARDEVGEIYSDIARFDGEPHLLLRCYAQDPRILQVEWELEKELMHGPSVMSERLRKCIALTVAMLSGCGG
jgi:hypothetical protein